jgi:hypothetical protein
LQRPTIVLLRCFAAIGYDPDIAPLSRTPSQNICNTSRLTGLPQASFVTIGLEYQNSP